MRPGLIVLGIGLGLLWVAGLSARATPWLVWFDFALAVGSLVAALSPSREGGLVDRPDRVDTATARRAPVGIGVLLVALWVLGLATGATPWLAWWTFGFGLAYVLFGLAGRPEVPARGPLSGSRAG
jgi:hypothetical protein